MQLFRLVSFLFILVLLALLFFKSKKFDNFLRKIFGLEKDADELLNQIIDADNIAKQKQDGIKKDAVKMKKKLDSLEKVRNKVSRSPKTTEKS